MKKVHGIYLPETDTHFDNMITPDGRGGGTYQLKKYLKAREYVQVRGVAVDIGAHVGLWSRVMARDFQQVLAFEPLMAHRDCFNLNLSEFSNVSLFPFALSDKEQDLNIVTPIDNTGHSHVAKGPSVSGNVEQVHAVRLDSFSWHEKMKIDFMKIDVEGWELAVLRGAEATIKKHRPVIIIEQKPHGNAERYGWGQHDAVKLLLSWGFRQVALISGDHILVG